MDNSTEDVLIDRVFASGWEQYGVVGILGIVAIVLGVLAYKLFWPRLNTKKEE